MELIANIFNPDNLLREVAAWSMYRIDKAFFNENLKRLEIQEQMHIQNLVLGQKFEDASELRPHMMFEIINFLKQQTLLGELPSYILASIVDYLEEIYFEDKTVIDTSEWHNECFYIIYSGSLEVKNIKGELIDQFNKGDFLGEQINIDLLTEEVAFTVVGDTVLMKIDKNQFLELITKEYDVTLKLLDSFGIQSDKIID
jgi:CRP-like cAMP-binding protein